MFGANGAGKSSFLKLLYGDLSPALGGVIERRGVPPGTPIADWKRSVGFVSPELQTDYAVERERPRHRRERAALEHRSCGAGERRGGARGRALAQVLRLSQAWRNGGRASCPTGSCGASCSRARSRPGRACSCSMSRSRVSILAQRAFLKRLLERLMRRVTLVIAVHHAEDLPRGVTRVLYLEAGRARADPPRSAD